MNLRESQAELSIKTIEFEHAMDQGLPRHDLIKIYKELKELHYQFLIESLNEQKQVDDSLVIE